MRLLLFLPVLSALLAPTLASAVPQQQSAPWGEKTDGRVEQFRNMWKDRQAGRQPGKMEKLVGNAEDREHGKYTNPKPYTQMGGGMSGAPPPPPKEQPKKQQPQQQPKQQQKKKKNGPPPPSTGGKKKGGSGGLHKRGGDDICSLTSLQGNGKYPDPEDFFKFSEEKLGKKYSPAELEAARDHLATQLAAAAKRDQERKSDDPPPVQCDDEFLAFAGIPKEEVAPPAPNVIEVEAKKLGFKDLASACQTKKATAPCPLANPDAKCDYCCEAGYTGANEFQDSGCGCCSYEYAGGDFPIDFAQLAFECRPFNDCEGGNGSVGGRGGVRGGRGAGDGGDDIEVDVSTNRDTEIYAVFEDIRRLCFFFDSKNNQDVNINTPYEGVVDIRVDTEDLAAAAADDGDEVVIANSQPGRDFYPGSPARAEKSGETISASPARAEKSGETIRASKDYYPGSPARAEKSGEIISSSPARAEKSGEILSPSLTDIHSLADAHTREEFDAKAAQIAPYGRVSDVEMLGFLNLMV